MDIADETIRIMKKSISGASATLQTNNHIPFTGDCFVCPCISASSSDQIMSGIETVASVLRDVVVKVSYTQTT